MPSYTQLLLSLIYTTFLLTQAQADCFFPDGSLDADGYPCNTTQGAVTHCCRTFEACLQRGICYTQWDSQLYRRSCTDEGWGEGCPTVCTDVDRSGGNGILACAQGTDPTYCCGNGSLSCCSPSNEFAFIPGDFLGVLDADGNLAPPLPPATTITRTSTLNAAGQTISSDSSTTAISSSSSSTVGSTTSTPSSLAASGDSSRSRTIGLAVGIPLGVLLVASVGGLFWFFNRRLNHEKEERKKLEGRLTHGDRALKSELETKGALGGRDGQEVAEVDAAHGRYEMPGGHKSVYETGTNTTSSRS